jgi:carbamoyl-phosphate synthase small subunit
MAEAIARKIVLEDGSEYYGSGFGENIDRVCEIVFNTSMVGYQEIVSDPSYTYQMVVMTYPLIGNYGTADDDFETRTPTIGGLAVRNTTTARATSAIRRRLLKYSKKTIFRRYPASIRAN